MEASIIIAVAAVVAVFATSLVKNVNWSSKVKHLVATGVSVVLAAVLFLTTESLDDVNFVTATTSLHGISQLIYNFVFSGTPLNKRLEVAIHGDIDTNV